jgi:hypothetical protein
VTAKDIPTESRIGKGYSYLFALALTFLLAGQSVSISFQAEKNSFQFAIATRELNPQIFYPCVMLIAAILGIPTDALALAFGKLLAKDD